MVDSRNAHKVPVGEGSTRANDTPSKVDPQTTNPSIESEREQNGDVEKKEKKTTHMNQSEHLPHELAAVRRYRHRCAAIHIRMSVVAVYGLDDRRARRRLGECRRTVSLCLRRVGDKDFGIRPIGAVDNMLRLGLNRLVVASRRCRCRCWTSSR